MPEAEAQGNLRSAYRRYLAENESARKNEIGKTLVRTIFGKDAIAEDSVRQPVIDGAEMAVLQGDPEAVGEYVILFRTDREIFVPPHWHPHDEHVRVVNGPFSLSINNQRSELEAGSKVVIPAKVHHSTWYGAGTQVEVSGMGPLESIYVDLDTLEA